MAKYQALKAVLSPENFGQSYLVLLLLSCTISVDNFENESASMSMTWWLGSAGPVTGGIEFTLVVPA